jgi:hypothetical protein
MRAQIQKAKRSQRLKGNIMAKKRNRGNGSGSIFKRREDGPYCITWYDATGKRREHNTLTTDKQMAERILADKLANDKKPLRRLCSRCRANSM